MTSRWTEFAPGEEGGVRCNREMRYNYGRLLMEGRGVGWRRETWKYPGKKVETIRAGGI